MRKEYETIEQEAYALFEKGLFKSAFIGDKSFFVKSDMGGPYTHDSGTVMSMFLDWSAHQHNITPIANKFASFLLDELINDKTVNPATNGLTAMLLIRIYCNRADKKHWWPMAKDAIVKMLLEGIRNYSNEELITSNFKYDIERWVAFFPESQAVLDEINNRLNKNVNP